MSQKYLLKGKPLNDRGRIVSMRALTQPQMIARLQRNEKSPLLEQRAFLLIMTSPEIS